MLNDWQQIGAEDPRVVELSSLLQRMPLHPQEVRQHNFRNANGVARKTADIATSHPDYQGRRTNGNALDRKVLDEFRARPDVMHALAESIRTSVTDGEPPDFPARSAMRARARWRGAISSASMLTASGAPVCAAGRSKACEGAVNRSPARHAGSTSSDLRRPWERLHQCHHVIPLHETGERRVSISDLALLCSNCHRMIHAKPPWPTPAELSEIIRRSAEGSGD